mmetsp:Transcript_90515/g.290162  ORF Transcript_90515/g.290162 Transcript_90515/m.290162 type:complete len:262 (+) Transcript_90515:52-837(+)
MQLLLESDGVYSSLCSPSNPSCGDRVSRLVLLYTVGSTGNVIGGAPCGFLVDHLGPQRCSLLSGLVVAAGLLLMGISEEDGFDAFLVGSFLIGFGGSFVITCSIMAAFVLPETRRTLYLAATNCLFDASSIVFLLIFMLYEHLNLSRHAIMVGFAITCALLHIALFMAWNMGPSAALLAEKVWWIYILGQIAAAMGACCIFAFVSGLGPLNPQVSVRMFDLSWREAIWVWIMGSPPKRLRITDKDNIFDMILRTGLKNTSD